MSVISRLRHSGRRSEGGMGVGQKEAVVAGGDGTGTGMIGVGFTCTLGRDGLGWDWWWERLLRARRRSESCKGLRLPGGASSRT